LLGTILTMSFDCNICLFWAKHAPTFSAFLPHVSRPNPALSVSWRNVFCQHLVHLKSILHLFGEPGHVFLYGARRA
jgi:hypothetical protein